MKNVMLFFAAALALILSGCASVINGNQTLVEISTNTPAHITILDYLRKPYHSGESPLKINLPHRTITARAAEFWVICTPKNEKYKKKEFFIKAKTSLWFLGNLLFIHPLPVIIGFSIDLSSDGRYCFDDKYEFKIPLK